MNNRIFSRLHLNSRRVAALSAILFAASLGAAFLQGSPDKQGLINLKVDSQEVNRGGLEPASYSKVARRVAPSVVKITVETKARMVQADGEDYGIPDPLLRQFFGGRLPQLRQGPESGLGSGVIISADGYIVTNNHVVEKADRVTVALDDGRELKARVVGRDPSTDLAVVKVDAKDLPAITFTDSAKVEVGDRVLAIGNPFGIGETVTAGIVSAKGRRPGLGLAYEDFIQTDAAINPGNSGGALVDVDGRLIGINTAILSRSGGFQGVGLAIPSDMVRSISGNLVQHGKVVRGYLGVNVQNVSPMLAESFGLGERKGALIADVAPGSPAAKAGLKDGDIVLSVDGKPVTDATQLSLSVSSRAPGTSFVLDVLRDGKPETIKVVSGNRGKQGEIRDLASGEESSAVNDEGVLNGVAVAEIDPNTRRQLNLPARMNGALITNVEEDSAAARSGLQAGDVILEINRKPVANADEAVKLTEEAMGPKTLVKLWSRGGTVYTVVDESESPRN